jgi:phosphoenolpyruvate carboxylase
VTDPHAPLRDDINLLGQLLGERLRASGDGLFDTVERVRRLSKAAHAPEGGGAFGDLASFLADLPTARARSIARAFSHFLTLANVAEQHHRIRRRRDYQHEAASPQPGSFMEVFGRLSASGVAPDAVHAAVAALSVELVFTAHPTEITRRTLAQAFARVADILARRDRPDLTPTEQEALVEALRREIAIIWGTDEVRGVKPTALDEVRAGLAVFEQTLWNAVPDAYRALDQALVAHTGRPLPRFAKPIRFGSWIGGDRDGNPNVTPDVTRRATLLARWVAADLFENDLQALVTELSLARGSDRLHARAGTREEPYRALLRDIRNRLRVARRRLEDALDSGVPRIEEPITARQLHDALALCHESLVETRNEAIANGRLLDVIRRAEVFGLALMPLDIREEAAKHTEAIDAISGGEYAQLDEPARVEWLLARLRGTVPLIPKSGQSGMPPPLETLTMAASLHRDSLGAYVITMASAPSDVLAVEYLQQLAGVTPRMRVVPLFETADDLHGAAGTLRDLLAIPWYRGRVDENAGRQEVMVGYSDSAKDAGRFAAAWDLYRAQEEIVTTCRDAGVKLTLFHGRGGSVGRGGGPTYLAIQSQPPGSIDGTLRVTEQGEMLQAKFGLRGIAERTLEIYVTATLEASLSSERSVPGEWREAMSQLADASRAAYRRTIEDKAFLEYFREATPERELELTNIGSRPSRRGHPAQGSAIAGTAPGVESLRAIPWQFAWTQTRLLLASWLGVEAALSADRDRALAARLYRQWPFFRSIVDLIEMVLAKADARIAAEYDRRLVSPARQPVGVELRQRLDRAIQGVLAASGHRVLVEENRVLRRSIDVRNPYVDPINLVQIELLRRLRSDAHDANRQDGDDDLARAFVVTVNGIAAGMRSTG